MMVSNTVANWLPTSFGGLEVKAHPILYLVAIVLASKSLQKFNGGHRSLKILECFSLRFVVVEGVDLGGYLIISVAVFHTEHTEDLIFRVVIKDVFLCCQ